MAGWTLLLKGGRVVDPTAGLDGKADVALDGARVAEVGPDLDPGSAAEVLDVRDRLVMPGIVDPHVHLTDLVGEGNGHVMLARAGVSTALDAAGPVDQVRTSLAREGAGLNVGTMQRAVPDDSGLSREPSESEARAYAERALGEGALGVKILGGHFPFSPEATARLMDGILAAGATVMLHVGTTTAGSDMHGLRQLMELGRGKPFYVAHLNSYCRGHTAPAVEEAQEALQLILANPLVGTESYLDPRNGVPGGFDTDGRMESAIARAWLERGGYPPTREGTISAIRDGWAAAVLARGQENYFTSGEEGAAGYRDAATPPAISFVANDQEAQRLLATAKGPDGRFIVPALCTDGGGLPRNTTLYYGLELVGRGDLTLPELVLKASAEPAGLWGLEGKGTLAPGSDADVCVVDLGRRAAVHLVVSGKVVMRDETVVGHGGTMLVTPRATELEPLEGVSYRMVPR